VFGEVGFECPTYTNPTDFYLKVVADEENENLLASHSQARYLEILKDEEVVVSEDDDGNVEEDEDIEEYPTSFWFQTYVLSIRFMRQWWRDPMMLGSEVGQYIFMALFLGSLYLGFDNDLEDGSFDRVSALWFSLACLCFTPPFTTITIFERERWLFLKESENNSYRISSYFIAKTLVMWPVEIFLCLLFGIISYWMMGFQDDAVKFINFIFFLIIFQLISESMGLLCATSTSNATFAILALSFVLIFLFAIGGFLTSDIPVYYEWIKHINYFSYILQACTKNEFEGLTFVTFNIGSDEKLFIPGEDAISKELKTDLSLFELGLISIFFLFIFRFLAYLTLLVQGKDRPFQYFFNRYLSFSFVSDLTASYKDPELIKSEHPTFTIPTRYIQSSPRIIQDGEEKFKFGDGKEDIELQVSTELNPSSTVSTL